MSLEGQFSGTFGPGTAVLSPTTIQNSALADLQIDVDITLWTNPDISFHGEFQCSVDGGTVWKQIAVFNFVGGVYTNKDGTPATKTSFKTALPAQVGGTKRKIQGSATISGGSVPTTISIFSV